MEMRPLFFLYSKPLGDSPLPRAQNLIIFSENRALCNITFVPSPSPNSTLILHSNHLYLQWFPEYSRFPRIPPTVGGCTIKLRWLNQLALGFLGHKACKMWDLVVKGSCGRFLLGQHQESCPRSLGVSASASCK